MAKRLRRPVVYALYGISFSMLIGGVALIGSQKPSLKQPYDYVSKGIMDYQHNIKVVNTDVMIIKPYVDQNVTISKNYYDFKEDSEKQEKSLIIYENTYIPSSGVSYSGKESFDVIAILPGTVKTVKEDDILGNVITVEHENGIVSEYQSISDIKVKVGDLVNQGQVLAKSSTSNISPELKNHLYFELIINGECVNPENYYNKNISEI